MISMTSTIQVIPISELEELVSAERACDLDDYFGSYDRVNPADLDPCPRPAAWAFRMGCCGSIELVCQQHYEMIMSKADSSFWGCPICLARSYGLSNLVMGINKA